MGYALLVLILVPAPKAPEAPAHPLVGDFFMMWGACPQDTRWDADGTYDCERFRGTNWCADDNWFHEQGGASLYGMRIDWRTLRGVGWYAGPGDVGQEVEVRLYRRERLRAPKAVP